MHTIIHTLRPIRRAPAAVASSTVTGHRKPCYDLQELQDAVKLTVYVPGVEAAGVDIEVRGPDVVVTARKVHFVRVNWQALHLESAQRDYQLRLRLGHGFDYPTLQAEIQHGVLSIVIPKRMPVAEALPNRRVA